MIMKGHPLKSFLSFFSGMSISDWILAASFTTLVAIMVNLLFPPNGWMIGIAASLALIFIAKRKRDRLMKDLDRKDK
ncbi:MAG: hypothetical protein FD147_2352 [Chloroflexi bacterium]|nr:MAG: hypothetical protein FD147_2352 [Chloroflexota bacterium]